MNILTDNFPPNITDVSETSSTESLQDDNLLQVEVGTTYTYQIEASDPNGDDIMFELNGAVAGAEISQGMNENKTRNCTDGYCPI